MSYYFRYRRPYYRRRYRRHGGGDSPAESFKALFILGVVFLFLISFSVVKTVIGNLIFLGLIIFGIVLAIKRISNRQSAVTVDKLNLSNERSGQEVININEINTEKHGCKCYMDNLSVGEQEIAHILSEGLSYKDYFIFNNLIVPSDLNGSSQIDHLVISRFGIFVIESKDFSGWIFGSKNQERWTQSLPGGMNKFQFQNPIRQNYSHIMALRKLMPFIPEVAFQNIVVFADSSEMKTSPIDNVMYPESLVTYITKYSENKLSDANLHMAIGKLSYVCQTVDISPSQHIDNLNLHHPLNELKD